MKTVNALFGLVAVMVAGAPRLTRGAELKPETIQAWNQYVRSADSHMRERLDTGHQFLWTDESPERSTRLRRGEILVAPMTGSGTLRVPDGLIHHWVGALFIPEATLESVLSVAHDYDHYKEMFRPKVVDSKLLACEDGQQKYSVLWLNNVLFVNAALRSQYEARDFPVDQRRWYNIAHVTSAQEIESYGEKAERTLPPGQGNGFIWRLQSIARVRGARWRRLCGTRSHWTDPRHSGIAALGDKSSGRSPFPQCLGDVAAADSRRSRRVGPRAAGVGI